MSSPIYYATVASPIGELLLTARDVGLTAVYFERSDRRVLPDWRRDDGYGAASATLAAARVQLAAYFDGDRTTFDLPLSTAGTPFQERVWRVLREIEFGRAVSYTEVARRVSAPKAVRAVGAANGRNPIPIIVPCHRVIGAGGALAGFGGGMERKRWLLDHERAVMSAGGEHQAEQLDLNIGSRRGTNRSAMEMWP